MPGEDPRSPPGVVLTLQPLAGEFCICRMESGAALPEALADPGGSTFYSLIRTQKETSILLPETALSKIEPSEQSHAEESELRVDRGWCGFELAGPFDFDQVGILVQLLEPLRDAEVGMLAVSSFDTDFLFVKQENRQRAIDCLRDAGVRFSG